MNDPADLSRAFIVNRPNDAARALEALTPADAAAFLATCPPEIVGPVLAALGDEQGAHLLSLMPDKGAAAILKEMEPNEAAFILRAAGETQRAALSEALPKRSATRVAQLLAYPRDQIGAWTRSDFLTVSPDLTVAQAQARAQASPYELDDPLFLIGTARAYAGAVRLADIVRARPNRVLRSLTVNDLAPLYDKSTLKTVADLTVWAIHNRVPVVDRRNRFVGVLSEDVLRQALGEAPPETTAKADDAANPMVQVTAGYTRFMASALQVLLGRPTPRS